MSLFIGNVSKNVRRQDLVDAFEKFGKCEVNIKGSFAFIEFDDERDAEDSRNDLNGKDMGGLKINIGMSYNSLNFIEWGKKSKKYDSTASTRPARRDPENSKCYNCNKTGHFARDCRSRRKSRSRSGGRRGDRRDNRSYGRQSRSKSDSRRRNSDRDRSQRDRSRSGSRKKKTRRSYSGSPRGSRERRTPVVVDKGSSFPPDRKSVENSVSNEITEI